MFIWLILGLWP